MAGNAVIGALRVNLGLDSAEFQTGLKEVQSHIGSLTKAFSGLAALGVFTAFSTQIGQAVGRIEEMRKLSAQLDRALENTGNTAKTSAEEIAGFADRLEKETGRAAEEVMAVSTNLATFGFDRSVFFDAIKLADDMSAAWGGDLKQNVEGLARALADPEKGLAMLTKRGITFTDQQKEMIAGFIKSNDLLGAQGVVMDALNEQVKGVASAGFGGLTKASANAWLAVEEFFEGIASGLQLNMGLESVLLGVAQALSVVTGNLGAVGKAMAVVGVALTTALGPAIWTGLSAAAMAFGQAAIAAIRGIGLAIAANPIGAIVVAFSAAVAAAFLFRDEIKKAIGIDFVGIVGDAVNAVIGGFVGGFEAIKATWSKLPGALGDLIFQGAENSVNGVIYLIRETQLQVRSFLKWVDEQLRKIGGGLDLGEFKFMDYADLNNPFEGQAGAVGDTISKAFGDAQKDYLGALGGLFSGVGSEVATATANVQGFGDVPNETTSSGGSGVSGLKNQVGGLAGALASAKDSMTQLWDSMRSGFTGIASGVTKALFATEDAAGKALNAVLSGLDQIASKALDMAFNGIFDMLLGAFGGNSLGGGWGKPGGFAGFAGIFGIPGLATGGKTMSAGLVEVGERGKELLALPAGAQVIRHSDVDGFGQSDSGWNVEVNIDARGATKDAAPNIANEVRRVLPDILEAHNRNPYRRP